MLPRRAKPTPQFAHLLPRHAEPTPQSAHLLPRRAEDLFMRRIGVELGAKAMTNSGDDDD